MTIGSRAVDALRLTTPDVGAVARSLLGVLAMTAVGLAAGSAAAAVWAAGAAAIAGAIAMQDSPGGRVPLVVTVSLEMGAAVLLGALTGAYRPLFVAVVAVWCLAAGLQWALGTNAGLVAAAATALLVIAPPVPPTVGSVTVATALTVAAGCLQAALIAVYPPRRWRDQREALARAYRSLADDARRVAADRQVAVDSAPLTWLREAFVDSHVTQRPDAYHGDYRLPEQITTTLSGFRGKPDTGHDGTVTQLLMLAAAFLDTIAERGHNARRDAEQALSRLDAACRAVEGPESTIAQRLSQQLGEAAALRFGNLHRLDLVGSASAAVGAMRSHLRWTSPILRHALRLSAATALGVAAARCGGLADGHWVALTVLVVLRPETAHTYTRCIGRIAGIGCGVLAAGALSALWQPTGSSAAVIAAALLAVTYGSIRFGYLAMTAALTAAVAFILDIDAAGTVATVADRLSAVALGGGLAVVAHVALPDHILIRLAQRAGELLKTEIDYAATVIRAFVHQLEHPADAMSSAWERAFRARAAFEAAAGATRVHTREMRRWLRSYRAALNAVTAACTALEAGLPGPVTSPMSPEFVAAVDDYVEALRGAPATPATPWTIDLVELSAAHAHVREQAQQVSEHDGAARILVAEIGAITRALSGIVAVREPGMDRST